jgi:hypothetical protein
MVLVRAIRDRRSGMIQEGALGGVGDRREDGAYRSWWEDGRFGQVQTFATNNNLAAWTEFPDRLSYYRGHRDGRRIREMLGSKGRTVGS